MPTRATRGLFNDITFIFKTKRKPSRPKPGRRFCEKNLDYFLRTPPPRGEETRGADALAAEDRETPDERTAVGRADERDADERLGPDMRCELARERFWRRVAREEAGRD
jgi:hypothetical protein